VSTSRVRRLRSRSALEARGLRAGWGGGEHLHGVDLRLRPGERLGVLGPNGAGKSTLFDVLAGRLKARSGVVILSGKDITAEALHRRARLGLGYVPQEPTAFPEQTVLQNLQVALASPAGRRPGVRRPAHLDSALDECLVQWGLKDARNRCAAVLSGGERRRLEVARALLCQPSVLLLDEPFAGLDPKGRQVLRTGLEQLPSATSLLVTDHAADDVLNLCSRVMLLVDGSVAFDGPSIDFDAAHPAHRRYFGVR